MYSGHVSFVYVFIWSPPYLKPEWVHKLCTKQLRSTPTPAQEPVTNIVVSPANISATSCCSLPDHRQQDQPLLHIQYQETIKEVEEEQEEEPRLQLENLRSSILIISHLNRMMMMITGHSGLASNSNSSIDGAGSPLLPPPYVHPMAKQSSSSLSDKSLDICTESLGSETGSDGFSSYPPSDHPGDHDDDPMEADQGRGSDGLRVMNYHYSNSTCRKLRSPPANSFPPPLPSLAERRDGSSIRIRSCRQKGRLVVDAVSVPSQNCFRARRQDGRLLLTLASATQSLDESDDHEEAAAIDIEEEMKKHIFNESMDHGIMEEEEEERKESQDQRQRSQGHNIKEANEQQLVIIQCNEEEFSKLPAARVWMAIDVPKIYALTMTGRRHHRFNKAVSTTTTTTTTTLENQPDGKFAQPLPSPRVARLILATPSFDHKMKLELDILKAYECYWLTNPTPAAAMLKQPLTHQAQQHQHRQQRRQHNHHHHHHQQQQQIDCGPRCLSGGSSRRSW